MPRKSKPSSSRSMDAGYKRLFSHPELMSDLIRGYVDPRVAQTFDLTTLERCNGSYVSRDLRERRNDVVWRMRSTGGWTYVYLLLEFQSTVDRYMAVRLLSYISLLWQDLIAQGQLDAQGCLPPVLPIVLYNGDSSWTAPLHLTPLIAPSPAFLARLQPTMTYRFLDENRVPTTGGNLLRNVTAAIFALEQCSDLAAQQKVIKSLRSWLKDRPDLREAIGTWYAEALAPTDLLPAPHRARISIDEVEPMMATRILKDIRRQVAEGKAEGKAEGQAEGMLEAIRQLVSSGALTVDAARTQVKVLLKAKKISASLAKVALVQLG